MRLFDRYRPAAPSGIALLVMLAGCAGDDAGSQVDRAFELLLSRKPTSKERVDSMEFLKAGELTQFAQVMFSLNEFAFLQ